jgi:predicted Fe-Mo cluster-binding NifX family protein
MVDSHFGQAERVYIFASDGETARLLEIRTVGEPRGCHCHGGQPGKRENIAESQGEKSRGFIPGLVASLSDVDAVVALRIGESPRNLMKKYGIIPFAIMDNLDQAALEAGKSLLKTRNGQYVDVKESQSLALA